MLPVLYTPEEIADAFRISPWWVREQARKGRVDGIKIAGAWRFNDTQVQTLLSLHTVSATAQQPTETTAPRRRAKRTADVAETPRLRLVAKPPRRRAG